MIRDGPTIEALEKIRSDADVRKDVEELAERDDQFGALARVILAIAHDERPADADLEAAGLESFAKLHSGGGE